MNADEIRALEAKLGSRHPIVEFYDSICLALLKYAALLERVEEVRDQFAEYDGNWDKFQERVLGILDGAGEGDQSRSPQPPSGESVGADPEKPKRLRAKCDGSGKLPADSIFCLGYEDRLPDCPGCENCQPKCKACEGTGECPLCDGGGKELIDVGGPVSRPVTCRICGGSGRCPACQCRKPDKTPPFPPINI